MRARPPFRTALVLAHLALIPVGAAFAQQDQYEQQVLRQLEEASAVFRNAGYTGLLGEAGALDHQRYIDYTATLSKGVNYAIVAVCDQDCLDVDLALYDGDGELVTQDESEDDVPVVEFKVTRGGDFTLRVTMYHCEENPCYYGVGLYGR